MKLNTKKNLTFLVFAYIAFAWIFGGEPYMYVSAGFQKLPPITYHGYLNKTVEVYGDTFYYRLLATIVYPGAKFGHMLHNIQSDK